MFGLGKLLNPSLAINVMKRQLKKQFGREIEVFDIVYQAEKDKLFFIIDKQYYRLTNDSIKQAIETQVKNDLKENQKLDMVILQVNFENILAKIAYTEGNEKIFVEHKLN